MSEAPKHVLPLDSETLAQLTYADRTTATLPAGALKFARQMVVLSILSGLCVAVCFAALAWGIPGRLLHLAVIGLTLGVGVFSGAQLRKTLGQNMDQVLGRLDYVAGAGLAILAIAPLFFNDNGTPVATFSILGIAFFLLSISTLRHRRLYRILGGWTLACGLPRAAKGLRALGNIKMVYEALWLSCCWLCLVFLALDGEDFGIWVALAAAFGCLGFGVIWVWMIIAHAVLVGRLKASGAT